MPILQTKLVGGVIYCINKSLKVDDIFVKIYVEQKSKEHICFTCVCFIKCYCYSVIFSCFTLWSMTWREASSLWISSNEIPISIISTIT